MSRDQGLYMLATLLISAHVVDATLQSNESLYFSVSLFVLPYVIISFLWPKLSSNIRFAAVLITLLLELNYAATDAIPEFVKQGLERSTFNGILFLPAIAILGILTWRLAVRLYQRRE